MRQAEKMASFSHLTTFLPCAIMSLSVITSQTPTQNASFPTVLTAVYGGGAKSGFLLANEFFMNAENVRSAAP